MGRYGGDQLNICLLIISLILEFIPFWPTRILALLILVVIFFRMFSKNIYRRRNENDKFLKIWYPVKNFFRRTFGRRPDAKTHKHFRCPKCHQEVRVPRGKGKIKVTCPKCGEQFIKTT